MPSATLAQGWLDKDGKAGPVGNYYGPGSVVNVDQATWWELQNAGYLTTLPAEPPPAPGTAPVQQPDGTVKWVDVATQQELDDYSPPPGAGGPIDDTLLVHKAGAETITGAKNFTGGITKNGQVLVDTLDARLANARVPTGHAASHAAGAADPLTPAAIAALAVAARGAVNGVAALGADGKVPSAQLPPQPVGDTFVVGSQAAMLATPADSGDLAVRTDLNKTFRLLTGADPTVLASWVEIPAQGAVTSVHGRIGNVDLNDVYDLLGAAAAARLRDRPDINWAAHADGYEMYYDAASDLISFRASGTVRPHADTIYNTTPTSILGAAGALGTETDILGASFGVPALGAYDVYVFGAFTLNQLSGAGSTTGQPQFLIRLRETTGGANTALGFWAIDLPNKTTAGNNFVSTGRLARWLGTGPYGARTFKFTAQSSSPAGQTVNGNVAAGSGAGIDVWTGYFTR